MTCEEDFRYI